MRPMLYAASLLALAALAGCKSAHVNVTVENHTGAAVRLLEVDYPNASFGADALAAGATMHYRIQLQGTGPVKVQYTGQDNRQPSATGPTLVEGQNGTLTIVLEPNGKAEFQAELK